MSDASAQFVIDIAAQMSGGAQTSEDLDRLTANLMGGGKDADHFQQAIKQLSQVLDVARAASANANDALSKGQQEYRKLEQAANQAGKAAEKAALKGPSPREAKAAHDASLAVNEYAATLKKLETSAKSSSAEEERLAKTLGNVKTLMGHTNNAIGDSDRQLKKLKGALPAIGGPLGSIGGKVVGLKDDFGDLTESFGADGAAAIAAVGALTAVVAIAVVVAAAVIAATVAVAAWAVSLADTARTAHLANDALQVMHPELVQLGPTMLEAAKATGLGSDKLNDLAKQLKSAGVAASGMPAALKAIALEQRALGDSGAQDFIDHIKAGKVAVGDLAAATQAKLGGIVAKQMLGIDAQSATLKTNIAGVFGGLNIEPLLAGLATIVSLFDKDTASGAALKFMFEGLFQPLIDGATKLIPYIVRAFLTLEIWALKAYIFVKPAIKAFEESGAAATLFKGVLIAIGLAVGIALSPVILLIAVFAAVEAAIMAVYYAGYQLTQWLVGVPAQIGGAFTAALTWIQGISWSDVGSAIMHGLATGITGSAMAVWHAITGAVSGAIDAAKNMLGIHSPSKVFAEIGANTVAGFAGGVDDNAPDAQTSLANMVSPSDAVASAGASPAPAVAAQTKSGATVTIQNLYARTVEDAKAIAEEITRILEGDAAQLGAET